MNPLLSVITVSLNASDSIEDTLASVSQQLRSFDLEHICVDGGSQDGTRNIIDRWANRSPAIVRLYEPDRGLYDAMNKGLRIAKGAYVLYLNADDFLISRDSLSTAMAGLTLQSPDLPDLIVCDVSMGVPGRKGFWRHRRVPRLLPRLRGFGLFPVHQGRLVRRSLLSPANAFDLRHKLAADVTQFYDLEHQHRLSIRVVPSDFAFMRSGGAANSSIGAMASGTVEIYRHLRTRHRALRAAMMTAAKTLQSLSEVRYGVCPNHRWFAEPPSD